MQNKLLLLNFKKIFKVKVLLLTVFQLLILTPLFSSSQFNAIEYIGRLPKKPLKPGQDTVRVMDLFDRFKWEVTFISNKGEQLHYQSSKCDTIETPDDFIVVKEIYSANFKIDSNLINKINSLHYDTKGSLKISINKRVIVQTGEFVKDKNNKLHNFYLNEYIDFVFNDTLQFIEIIYSPLPNESRFEISISQYDYAKGRLESHKISEQFSFAKGFYYLAFGLIFLMIFLFYNLKKENLYFAGFCIMASFSSLVEFLGIDTLGSNSFIFIILSLEFLSLFLSKMLLNKEKSKISLVVILIISILINLPFFRLNITSNSNGFHISGNSGENWIFIIALILLIIYEGFSNLYYLLQGFGQKRWEAKVIVYICTIATLLLFAVPFILTALDSYGYSESKIGTYLSFLALAIYPISGAIVLGRRNGLDQKKLLEQINSIKKLSDENLEKELEKKQILEKQNQELEQKVNERTREVLFQKDELEIKSKSITDNLNYAKRIQSAILPDINLIYKTLEDSFIIYYPKDIVSGDFYAFAEKNDRVLIIAGDCTGHGVSGAFMSMIGVSLLNQLINEGGVVEPDLILNQLNSSIIDTFRQSVSESNDGMDVSVCSFDMHKGLLQYAGANRPLWLVRDNALITFNPDKFPIGGLQNAKERVFKLNEIKLQKNDSIYIFTDGYADQFGGERGKKMMTAKFKEKLMSIQSLSMKDQEVELKNHFNNWKGNNEQVDDVLVIGIRI